MSGIYIKGMEMPTSPVLFCIHPDGKVFADLEGGWREYKAVPVPEHGRLIDADAMCDGLVLNNPVVIYAECMPTVLPADKEEQT